MSKKRFDSPPADLGAWWHPIGATMSFFMIHAVKHNGSRADHPADALAGTKQAAGTSLIELESSGSNRPRSCARSEQGVTKPDE
jgi:hypothetical protein